MDEQEGAWEITVNFRLSLSVQEKTFPEDVFFAQLEDAFQQWTYKQEAFTTGKAEIHSTLVDWQETKT
jgi:hypothetical protein